MTDTVLLIGAGGLGCGAAYALAAGGLRRLVVVDPDVVDETNLHRQILHAESAVGKPKVLSLAATLGDLFSALEIVPIEGRFDSSNAFSLLEGCAVCVDGSDNLATKFLANDAAVISRRPLVHGAAIETGGQLLTVPVGGHPCYRCLFEELPPEDPALGSCAAAGVLGPVPGVIGALQAAEALRLLAGKTPAFAGRLIRYDSRSLAMRTVRFRPNPHCRVCGTAPSITSLVHSAYAAEECTP